MQYDIIDIPEEEVEKLGTVQLKMLRTAQQKKDELYHKVELDMKMFRQIVMTAGTDAYRRLSTQSGRSLKRRRRTSA